MPAEDLVLLRDQPVASESTEIQNTYSNWHDYLYARSAIAQTRPDGFSIFRMTLDQLGLSNDADAVILRFHLWMQHALTEKTNIGMHEVIRLMYFQGHFATCPQNYKIHLGFRNELYIILLYLYRM